MGWFTGNYHDGDDDEKRNFYYLEEEFVWVTDWYETPWYFQLSGKGNFRREVWVGKSTDGPSEFWYWEYKK